MDDLAGHGWSPGHHVKVTPTIEPDFRLGEENLDDPHR